MSNSPRLVHILSKKADLAAIANEHHIAGLLYYHFPEIEVFLHGKQKWQEQWLHNQRMLAEIRDLGVRLLSLELKSATLLKGTALFRSIYQDLGSRFISDCDIYVHPKEHSQIVSLIEEAGFVSIQGKTWKANDFKREFTKMVDGSQLNLELHTRLFYHSRAELDLIPSGPSGWYELELHDQLLHLIGHLGFQHSFLKLYWLFDIYFLIISESTNIKWDQLIVKAKKSKLEVSLSITLFLMEKYFGIKHPLPAYYKHSKLLDRILDEEYLFFPLKSKMKYLLVKHLLKDSWQMSMAYNLNWSLFQLKEKFLSHK